MERIVGIDGWPLAAFIAAYPTGSYVVHRRGHAFAVIDGVLRDWDSGTGPRSIIQAAWRVTEKTREKILRTKALFE